MQKLLLKPGEVGEALGVSRAQAYKMVAEGAFPSVRIGRSVRVRAADLEKWVAALGDAVVGDGLNKQ